jgi:hypothetical protein
MITKRRTTRVVGAGLTAVLALAGCSTSSEGSSAPKDIILNVYIGASGAFAENWNPLSPTALSNTKGLLYEGLFSFNNLKALGDKPVPLLVCAPEIRLISQCGWVDGTNRSPYCPADVDR